MKFSTPLKFNYEFTRIYRRGKYLSGRYVVLHYISHSRKTNRIGVTTSKTIGGSVQRNRMRRLLRECYRLNESGIKRGYDIILLGRGGAPEIVYSQVNKEVLHLMKKAGILIETADEPSPAAEKRNKHEENQSDQEVSNYLSTIL